MFRRLLVLALGAVLLGLPVSARAQGSLSPSVQEGGNPITDQRSNYNYRSNIAGLRPDFPCLDLEVLQFAGELAEQGCPDGFDRSLKEAW